MQVKLKTPAVPNYLTALIPGATRLFSVPVSEVSEADLRQLGAEWTEELVAKSKQTITPRTRKAKEKA